MLLKRASQGFLKCQLLTASRTQEVHTRGIAIVLVQLAHEGRPAFTGERCAHCFPKSRALPLHPLETCRAAVGLLFVNLRLVEEDFPRRRAQERNRLSPQLRDEKPTYHRHCGGERLSD